MRGWWGQSSWPDSWAILHCDSSTYGWGGVLDGAMPVRGDWSASEQRLHITLKELRAVRLTIEQFAEELRGKRIRLFEDNQAVVGTLTTLTSHSPALMTELRRTWRLLRFMSAEIRAEYIPSAANVWADHLSQLLDPGDYQYSIATTPMHRQLTHCLTAAYPGRQGPGKQPAYPAACPPAYFSTTSAGFRRRPGQLPPSLIDGIYGDRRGHVNVTN